MNAQHPATDAVDSHDGRGRHIADIDIAVIGGGQAGLAAGYFLRRAKADFVILDAQSRPGGGVAARLGLPTPVLPARYSPLPGWWMPDQPGEPFPTADHVRDYLTAYEAVDDPAVEPRVIAQLQLVEQRPAPAHDLVVSGAVRRLDQDEVATPPCQTQLRCGQIRGDDVGTGHLRVRFQLVENRLITDSR